jgi:hypothetical protein
VIRGIHKNLDTLFEQIDSDITTNIELLPHHQKQQVSFKEILKEILFFLFEGN